MDCVPRRASWWLNRDPIQERGGINLYGICGNNAVNFWDYLGREWQVSGAEDLQKMFNALLEKAKKDASEEIRKKLQAMQDDKKVCKLKLVYNSNAMIFGGYTQEAQYLDLGGHAGCPSLRACKRNRDVGA